MEDNNQESSYMAVFFALFILTAAEVGITYIPDLDRSILVGSLLVMAFAKAAMVAFWYMHLKTEGWLVYLVCAVPLCLVGVLIGGALTDVGSPLWLRPLMGDNYPKTYTLDGKPVSEDVLSPPGGLRGKGSFIDWSSIWTPIAIPVDFREGMPAPGGSSRPKTPEPDKAEPEAIAPAPEPESEDQRSEAGADSPADGPPAAAVGASPPAEEVATATLEESGGSTETTEASAGAQEVPVSIPEPAQAAQEAPPAPATPKPEPAVPAPAPEKEVAATAEASPAPAAPEATAAPVGSSPAPELTPEPAPAPSISGPVITGRIHFQGTPPKMRKIRMSQEMSCQAHHPTPLREERVVINDDGSLRNVFVYVKSGLPADQTYPVPSEPMILNQVGCQYVPHVLGIQVNQPLKILNSDRNVLHNVHSFGLPGNTFNIGQPGSGIALTQKFARPEIMARLKCDVHGWMASYVGVMTHPYFSVSGDAGQFQLPELPAGEYVIAAWHEEYGTQEQTVTLGSDPAQVEFTFSGE